MTNPKTKETTNRTIQMMKLLDRSFKIIMRNMLKEIKLFQKRTGNYTKKKQTEK